MRLFISTLLVVSAQAGRDQFPDSILAAATRAIDAGRPWQATRLLAPLTKPAAKPAVRLAAARAAAEWEGWESVERLLEGEPWLDQLERGAGRALLGRALVERGRAAAALIQTGRAVALATPENRGERLVTHARALDRLDQLDSAAAVYRAAAAELPVLKDWLRLRAAGVTTDSAERGALLATLALPAPRARIKWTEALARSRAGDWAGAADRYAALGARLAAVRLRLTGGDLVARAAGRQELVALLGSDASPGDAADAIALFDEAFVSKTAAEEIRIARRAAAINQLDRAARGFAAGRSLWTDRDRFTYATVLARLNRGPEAVTMFDGVTTEDQRGDAAYQQARMMVRTGQPGPIVRALERVWTDFPRDSEPAASALFLAADLLADRGRDDSARIFFSQAGARYPTTTFGRRGAFQAALIAYLDNDYRTAAAEFERIAASPSDPDAIGALYWAGRTHAAAGDTAAAAERWHQVATRGRDTYYAWRAAARLGTDFRRFEPRRGSDATVEAPDPLTRVRFLRRLGLKVEARFELDAYVAAAGNTAASLAATATALAASEWHARAMRVAERAVERGAGFDRSIAALLYPLPYESLLRSEALQSGLDPMLAAGVIRQESLFDSEARSVADARGLMQVVPSVGAELARRAALPEWDPVLLYQPDVNLDFGIEHLADALKRLHWPERALAAYNAGLDRVSRWQSIRGVDQDPEIFVERIPFTETRDYVRRVLKNVAMYHALYPKAGS